MEATVFLDRLFATEADNKMLAKHLKHLYTKWERDFLFMNRKNKTWMTLLIYYAAKEKARATEILLIRQIENVSLF